MYICLQIDKNTILKCKYKINKKFFTNIFMWLDFYYF